MGRTGKSFFRSFYVFFKDGHARILRVFIFLLGFAALGLVLFGRDVRAISLVVAIGSAFLFRYKIWH
jgi:hypothetical protein